jgi:SHS2 domain-containing protein
MCSLCIIEDGAFADFEFEASADSIENLFIECGKAVFIAITDISQIAHSQTVEFEIKGESLEDLLFAFLSELIFLKDTRKMFFCDFELTFKDCNYLYCKAMGELFNSQKHLTKTDVKAATYHKMKIEKSDAGFSVRVILDL